MSQATFQIEHDDFAMRYDPSAGTVCDLKKGNVVKVDRKRDRWDFRQQHDSPAKWFMPNCLTIYLNHTCNLNCDYCYRAVKETLPRQDISMAAVRASAEFVAGNCRRTGRPFVLGFHGGNEPLLSRALIEDALDCSRRVADKYRLQVLPFCTTNGVIDQSTAEWAARTFRGITLSWDGDQETHDRYRKYPDHRPTFEIVRRTAETFKKKTHVTLRVTVTRDSVHQLAGIARYFGEQGYNNVQVYPVYAGRNGQHEASLAPDQDGFVYNFLKARAEARRTGTKLMFSGTRWGDLHGRFCTVNQENLTITPDGFVTTCFLATHNVAGGNNRYIYGRYHESSDTISIDWQRLASLSRLINQTNPQCDDCFNSAHCARNCPSVCPLSEQEREVDFDCTINKFIGLANIIEAAGGTVDIETSESCMNFLTTVRITKIAGNGRHE